VSGSPKNPEKQCHLVAPSIRHPPPPVNPEKAAKPEKRLKKSGTATAAEVPPPPTRTQQARHDKTTRDRERASATF